MCNYPASMLPGESYKGNLAMKALIRKYPGLLVLRQVSGKLEDFLEDDGQGGKSFSDRLISAGETRELSMNLLGAGFDLQFFCFRPKSERALEVWREGMPQFVPTEEDFLYLDPCFYVCFYAKDLHETYFPFPYAFQKEDDLVNAQKAASQRINESAGEDVKAFLQQKFLNAQTKVCVPIFRELNHAPIRLNYWHVTLDCFHIEKNRKMVLTEQFTSANRKQMKALKQDLVERMITPDCMQPVSYKIARRFYKHPLSLMERMMDILDCIVLRWKMKHIVLI